MRGILERERAADGVAGDDHRQPGSVERAEPRDEACPQRGGRARESVVGLAGLVRGNITALPPATRWSSQGKCQSKGEVAVQPWMNTTTERGRECRGTMSQTLPAPWPYGRARPAAVRTCGPVGTGGVAAAADPQRPPHKRRERRSERRGGLPFGGL